MGTHHKIITGDSRAMAELPDNSVHLIITSPPYWQLKDYGSENQIGFHDDYESYINNLNLVWKECYRVLHDGCKMCINIGDQFARSVYYGRYKVIPIREEIIKFCEILGFDYMGAIIWQKVTTSHTTGGGVQMGSYPYPRNGIIKLDYEFILIFKKQGESPKPSKEQKELSRLTPEEWNSFFAGHWNFPGVKQNQHIAMFPEELPRRLIKMFSFVGETVLDPFLGSGTTSLVAKKLARNSVGYEINPRFTKIIKDKLQVNQSDIEGTTYEFIIQPLVKANFDKKIEDLPYIFRDPHKFDKKIDVKKLQFGSKIDLQSNQVHNEVLVVKEVISPVKLRLSNGLIIKLLGVKEEPSVIEQALLFLNTHVKGKKVFLKFDKEKYDAGDCLLCYVYLENRTFINAHLIKRGLATVDENFDFKYKSRFQNLMLQQNG